MWLVSDVFPKVVENLEGPGVLAGSPHSPQNDVVVALWEVRLDESHSLAPPAPYLIAQHSITAGLGD